MFCFFFVGPSQYSLFHTAEGMVQGPPDGLSGGSHTSRLCPRASHEADAQGRSWGRQGKRQEVAETTHGNGIISKIGAIYSTAARVYLGPRAVETLVPPSETVFSRGFRFLSASVFSVKLSWSFLLAYLRGWLVSCFLFCSGGGPWETLERFFTRSMIVRRLPGSNPPDNPTIAALNLLE